jgi:hypothetical protein
MKLVGAAGLEPATTCLEGRCSIHLSYAPAFIYYDLRGFSCRPLDRVSLQPFKGGHQYVVGRMHVALETVMLWPAIRMIVKASAPASPSLVGKRVAQRMDHEILRLSQASTDGRVLMRQRRGQEWFLD